jgi:dCTP deaminase
MEISVKGALPAQMLEHLIDGGNIIGAEKKHISPASLDLTVSSEIYTINGLLLPKVGENIDDLLHLMEAEKTDFSQPLAAGQMYLVKLNESLSLPKELYGYCNPKSSTGRLDVHIRVLADGVPRFDSITPRGFSGQLWAAIFPQSFAIKLEAGIPLTQLRLFTEDTRFTEADLKNAMDDGLVFNRVSGEKLEYTDLVTNDQDGSVVLSALVEEGICGYECIADPSQVIDVQNIAGYAGSDFFKPLTIERGALRLKRDRFYILSGAEAVRIPPNLASEMVPMDERSGDFRSHYAGFLDPGWGYGKDGEGKGRPFTLEVRPFEDLVVRAGQPIAKIRFEKMAEVPVVHYDTKVSNYLIQSGPKLGKQFKS